MSEMPNVFEELIGLTDEFFTMHTEILDKTFEAFFVPLDAMFSIVDRMFG